MKYLMADHFGSLFAFVIFVRGFIRSSLLYGGRDFFFLHNCSLLNHESQKSSRLRSGQFQHKGLFLIENGSKM